MPYDALLLLLTFFMSKWYDTYDKFSAGLANIA